MTSIPHLRAILTAAAAGLFALVASPAQAQALYLVNKIQFFSQSSATGALADPVQPFVFSAKSPTAATLTLPGGSTQSMTFVASDSNYELNRAFATKAALDAAYPAGTYRMTGGAIPTLSFNLATEVYPTTTPQLTGGTWSAGGLLVIDPTKTATITFNPFAGYGSATALNHIETRVDGLLDNVSLDNQILNQSLLGQPATTTPLTTIAIPAGTLTSGRVYQGAVKFETASGFDTASVPLGAATTIFSKILTFYIAALAPGTTAPAAPVITAQPTSQIGVLGGNATFTFASAATLTDNTTSIIWSFNGLPINLDGTKYTFVNGPFLRISNLTTADVGTYAVTLINASGIARSSSATLTLGTATAPVITAQPQTVTVTNGSTVALSVTATGLPAPTFQWLRGSGQPGAGTVALIPGATGQALVLSGTTGNTAALAGSYSVVVSNGTGSPVTSAPATVAFAATSDIGRLTNLSVLTDITADTPNFTVGTVIDGAGPTATKSLVVRAVGPSLGAIGVPGTLGDPKLELFSGATSVTVNDNWGGSPTLSAAMAGVGAFAFTGPTSLDAAAVPQNLAPGGYTVVTSGVGGSVGTALAEIYDATPAGTFSSTSSRLINVSVLKPIGAGATLTLGFTIGGSTAKTVLIRAIGPGLAAVGIPVASSLGDPQLTLFNSSSVVIGGNNDITFINKLLTLRNPIVSPRVSIH